MKSFSTLPGYCEQTVPFIQKSLKVGSPIGNLRLNQLPHSILFPEILIT